VFRRPGSYINEVVLSLFNRIAAAAMRAVAILMGVGGGKGSASATGSAEQRGLCQPHRVRVDGSGLVLRTPRTTYLVLPTSTSMIVQ